MKIGVLFSGGKDSSLAALLLRPFAEVELVSVSFGLIPNDASTIAHLLGFPHISIEIEEELAGAAVEAMISDGYPNNGIKQIHENALERASAHYHVVADGTRRDDKVPLLTAREARSLEDRLGIDYVRPLLGYGRRFIDELVSAHLNVKYGKCVSFDYEVELRSIMESVYGQEAVDNIFPEDHVQSKVIGRKAQFLSYSRVKNY